MPEDDWKALSRIRDGILETAERYGDLNTMALLGSTGGSVFVGWFFGGLAWILPAIAIPMVVYRVYRRHGSRNVRSAQADLAIHDEYAERVKAIESDSDLSEDAKKRLLDDLDGRLGTRPETKRLKDAS